jgi:HicA toxin of bacterial toxin-antitoxin,
MYSDVCPRHHREFQDCLASLIVISYIASMNSRHRKTLEAVFAEPTKTNIVWADIEALLVAVGCALEEGSGSRVKFDHGNETFAFHRPHPRKEALRYQVKDARTLLTRIGVRP